MAKASAAIDIPASPNEVWQLLGGFNSLPDWLSYIPKSELSEGGRVRHLSTLKGEIIVERLEEFDNTARSYRYSIVQAPFPVTGYLSTLEVKPAADGKGVARPVDRDLHSEYWRERRASFENLSRAFRRWP